MDEVAPELRINGIVAVVKPRELDAAFSKNVFFEVVLCRRAGNVFASPCLRAKFGQPFGFSIDQPIVPRVADFRPDAQVGADGLDEFAIQDR